MPRLDLDPIRPSRRLDQIRLDLISIPWTLLRRSRIELLQSMRRFLKLQTVAA